ncbi:inorganic phosphate transporter [Bacillus sp. 03113]|uniref:inorganic phosphate transporter n=1 Tax=Bacillus sp. 03113 TaxID=2578211 RepID=UPI0011430E1C|nr:inorganic phosphate transporter [Bacillus sp. 03113]
MIITYLACFMALFFAMNIGASGAAASISVAYGSGAISSKRKALIICGIAIFLGAVIGGSEVVKTIGEGLIPKSFLSPKVVLIILSSAAMSLFFANLIGIPLSTSEITVGSVVGAGVAFHALYITNILWIVLFWILVPGFSFILALFLGKIIKRLENRFPQILTQKYQRIVAYILIIVGFFEAFSAGMNNVANAIGPLVGADLISISFGIFIGGIFISIGAMFLGGKVLQTNGKKITKFSLQEGVAISGTGAFLVILSSIFGLPVPLTQVTSTAIMGIGVSQDGFSILRKQIINKILKVWIVSPIFSLVISYGLVKFFVQSDIYTVVVLAIVCISTLGTISLIKTIREDSRATYEQGGGI